MSEGELNFVLRGFEDVRFDGGEHTCEQIRVARTRTRTDQHLPLPVCRFGLVITNGVGDRHRKRTDAAVRAVLTEREHLRKALQSASIDF